MNMNVVLLGFMLAEADALHAKAKAYRIELDALPENDSRKPIYESVISFLLSRSRALSLQVQALSCTG